jgi:hypothetical protein
LGWLLFMALAAMTAARLGTDLTYDRGLGVPSAWPDNAADCFELERQPPG